MLTHLEVLMSPAEFATLPRRDLSKTACVVFDVFRATSTALQALQNGAEAIMPAADIRTALAWREKEPDILLAGERNGFRIGADLTGGIEFDLGNSPREFTQDRVQGRWIVMTTSNGTRAIDACRGSAALAIASFGNLAATTDWLYRSGLSQLVIVCAGTLEHSALEDTLGAGALVDRIWNSTRGGWIDDAAQVALQVYRSNHEDILSAAGQGRNGSRLLSLPELADDVPLCLIPDRFDFAALRTADGSIRREQEVDAGRV